MIMIDKFPKTIKTFIILKATKKNSFDTKECYLYVLLIYIFVLDFVFDFLVLVIYLILLYLISILISFTSGTFIMLSYLRAHARMLQSNHVHYYLSQLDSFIDYNCLVCHITVCLLRRFKRS